MTTTNSNYSSQLALLATAPMSQTSGSGSGNSGSWFEALARAWGQALDKQASAIQTQSDAVNSGGTDNPSAITELSTDSLKFSFLANSSSNSINSVGQGLETMARKG